MQLFSKHNTTTVMACNFGGLDSISHKASNEWLDIDKLTKEKLV